MLGIMYIGVLSELTLASATVFSAWHKQLKGVAGASAGAIVAFLVAAGVQPKEMEVFLGDTPLGSVSASATSSSVADMLQRGAVCDPGQLDTVLQELVRRVLHTPGWNPTLADLATRGGPDLVVVVTNAITGVVDFWKASSHPTVPVWFALRASASVPGLFPAAVWEGVPYLDGGVTCNLPCHLFPARQTLSLFVHMGGPEDLHLAAAPPAMHPKPDNDTTADALAESLMQVVRKGGRMVQWYMCAAQLGPLRASVDRIARCVPCVPVCASALLGPTGAFSFDADAKARDALMQDGARSVHAVVARDVLLLAYVLLLLRGVVVVRRARQGGRGGPRTGGAL